MKKSVLRKAEPYLWILPSIVLMAIFILIPIVFVFLFSFCNITISCLIKFFNVL